MKKILNHLFDHAVLTREEARDILLQISRGEHNDVHISAFTTVYQMRPITVSELQGFSDALLEICEPLDTGGINSIDIVGTGGDGKNTFNISTTSAFVIAGAGYKVTKHGSYGVSSNVGSSNVLQALGYEFTNDQPTLRKQLEDVNICFLHAPLFHPALKNVVPVRRQLGMKTFFNMLGPLVNPVQPKWQLFGTYNLELSRLYQYVMQETDRHFSIVFGMDGYDEISLTGPIKWRSRNSEQMLYPKDLGLPTYVQEDLFGGHTPEEAQTIMLNVLQNNGTSAQKDVVIANAGLAIHTIKPEQSLEDCLSEARESIESQKAFNVLKKLIR
jgi:anthranilate phosphoribosyltransferase